MGLTFGPILYIMVDCILLKEKQKHILGRVVHFDLKCAASCDWIFQKTNLTPLSYAFIPLYDVIECNLIHFDELAFCCLYHSYLKTITRLLFTASNGHNGVFTRVTNKHVSIRP